MGLTRARQSSLESKKMRKIKMMPEPPQLAVPAARHARRSAGVKQLVTAPLQPTVASKETSCRS